ncbi:MAG: hypothetical protein ACK4OE_01565 [Acidovorax sp.]|uniref:hypothetical protein n=1 Tax=Acidovorax sp. TaxID=1872122 RepID=UPI003918C16A
MSAPPTIALLGAPGTGAATLALDLRQRIAATSAQIVCATNPEDCPQATLTLLMGLDLPCTADQQAAREAADARLRAALAHGGRAYRVVYGLGERRIESALQAIKSIAASAYGTSARGTFDSDSSPRSARLRAWNCEKCSDPECEHRLFTALTGRDASNR